MKILKRNIQNNKVNYTRFLVISKKKTSKGHRHPKSTISFDLKSIPGALHKALKKLSELTITIKKIGTYEWGKTYKS